MGCWVGKGREGDWRQVSLREISKCLESRLVGRFSDMYALIQMLTLETLMTDMDRH